MRSAIRSLGAALLGRPLGRDGRNGLTASGLTWVLVGIGAALQLANLAAGRSLWLDEAYLVYNFQTRTPSELLHGAYFSQIAPVGWLQVEAFIHRLTHALDVGLRIVPTLAGLASLVLFRGLALRVLSGAGAVVAVGLFCLSPQIIAYAAMIKPYSADVLASVLILRLALPALLGKVSTLRDFARLAAGGLVALLMSFPVVYVLGGVGAMMFTILLWDRRWREAGVIAGVGAACLAAFAGLYFGLYAPQVKLGSLRAAGTQDFFSQVGFIPSRLDRPADLRLAADQIFGWFKFYFPTVSAAPALAICLIGGVVLACSRAVLAGALGLILIGAFVGSALHIYPLFDRLTLFLFPAMLLAMGAALGATFDRSPPSRWVALALTALVLFGPIKELQWWLRRDPPFAVTHVTPALSRLAAVWRPGDGLYVQASSAPAYLVYRGRYGLSRAPWILGYQASWRCLAADPTISARPRSFVLAPIGVGNRSLPPLGAGDLAAIERLGFSVKVLAAREDLRLLQLDRSGEAGRLGADTCPLQEPYPDFAAVVAREASAASPP